MNDQPEQAVEIDLTNRFPPDFVSFCRTIEPLLARYAMEYGETTEAAGDVVTVVLAALFHDWPLIAPNARFERAFRTLCASLTERRSRRRATSLTRSARSRADETFVEAPEEFVVFWGANKRDLTRYARKILRSDRDAEEVASDALFELYRCWDARGRQTPHAVVYQFVKSRAVDRLRRRQRTIEKIPTDFAAPDTKEVVSTTPTLDDPGDTVPDYEIFLRTVEGMPERRAACVRLHLQMRLPLQDVSVLLGVSMSTVRTHIQLARQELRRVLHPRTPDPTPVTRVPAGKGNA
ncbi:RNA polymerase sigma factor [Streptomyces sp. SID3343]|uniref:RNA polymerase sigma factor n=1 Tax=Streptomyces sp. SID3343 TaxID=2690260 RepID=UPI00136AF2D1|nr:RNA polymerase sigma factor [Streptomyces sp. SID3343]MYW06717.1 sigma-70 family RNA polymerase sigma factor [Streptomyces sp. SID3343]